MWQGVAYCEIFMLSDDSNYSPKHVTLESGADVGSLTEIGEHMTTLSTGWRLGWFWIRTAIRFEQYFSLFEFAGIAW